MSRLTGGRDEDHRVRGRASGPDLFESPGAQSTSAVMMTGAAKLRGGLDQQGRLRTGVMSGMTREAAQVRVHVLLADLGLVATLATPKNNFMLGARIAFNLVGISARADVTGARPVASPHNPESPHSCS